MKIKINKRYQRGDYLWSAAQVLRDLADRCEDSAIVADEHGESEEQKENARALLDICHGLSDLLYGDNAGAQSMLLALARLVRFNENQEL